MIVFIDIQIIKNSELTALLMDVEFQKIIQECNNPILFQKHMKDPNIAAKIRLLHESGLVATVK